MNDLTLSLLCGSDMNNQARNEILKYIYCVDVEKITNDVLGNYYFSEEIDGQRQLTSNGVDIFKLIGLVYDEVRELWKNDYGSDEFEYYSNLLKTSLNYKRYFSDVELVKITGKEMDAVLEKYLDCVLLEHPERDMIIKFLTECKLKSKDTDKWISHNAKELVENAKDVLYHVLSDFNSKSIDDKFEYNRFKNPEYKCDEDQAYIDYKYKCENDIDYKINVFLKNDIFHISDFSIYLEKEKELYTEMAARNILQLYLCDVYNDKVKFTKSYVGSLYNVDKVRNDLYKNYKNSRLRSILYGNDEEKSRQTYNATCFLEYMAMRTTLFSRFDREMIIIAFANLYESDFMTQDDIDFYNDINNQFMAVDEDLDEKEEYKQMSCIASKNFKKLSGLLERNYKGDKTELYKVNFNKLCDRLNKSRNEIIEAFPYIINTAENEAKKLWKNERKMKSNNSEMNNKKKFNPNEFKEDLNMLLYCADYMIERLYAVNQIHNLVATKKSINEGDSERIIRLIKNQNLYMRDIFFNMRTSDANFYDYATYEAEFFYPLFMHVVQYTLNRYIERFEGVEEVDAKREISRKLFATMKSRYNIKICEKDIKELDLKHSKEEIDKIYKRIWNYYDKQLFITNFEKYVTSAFEKDMASKVVNEHILGY